MHCLIFHASQFLQQGRQANSRTIPPKEHSRISQLWHSQWILSLELTFLRRRKMISLPVFVSIQVSFIEVHRCMKPFLFLLPTIPIFTSVPPLIALDAEISLNRMSTTFFSVTTVPSIKNFICHLIVLTLSDFTSTAEHRRKKGFTSSVAIL